MDGGGEQSCGDVRGFAGIGSCEGLGKAGGERFDVRWVGEGLWGCLDGCGKEGCGDFGGFAGIGSGEGLGEAGGERLDLIGTLERLGGGLDGGGEERSGDFVGFPGIRGNQELCDFLERFRNRTGVRLGGRHNNLPGDFQRLPWVRFRGQLEELRGDLGHDLGGEGGQAPGIGRVFADQ